MATDKRTKRNTPSKLGFTAGVFLIVLAFVLMGVRVFLAGTQASLPQQTSDTPENTARPIPQERLDALQERRGDLGTGQLTMRPVNVEVPVREHNPRLGRINAPNQIVLFGNLSCAACHKALRVAFNHTRENPMSTRLVSKFAAPDSTDEGAVEAGLFAAIATDERLYWDAFALLEDGKGFESNNGILDALNKAGVPLKTVRKKLATRSQFYMQNIEQDLDDFANLQAEGFPVIIINGQLMEPRYGQPIHQQLSKRLLSLK